MTIEPRGPAGARPATVAEVTYAALKDDLLAGVLGAGGPLLTRELIERYGCGISPLREALARLVAEGLLETESHRGVRVPVPTLADLADVYRLRITLECDALKLAMEHGDDDWEARIVAAAHRLERAPLPQDPTRGPELRDWEARHRAFHASLVSAAPSPRLLRLVAQMVDQTERYRAIRVASFAPERVGSFIREHQELRDAAIARDPGAADLLARHLESSRDALAKVLAGPAKA